MTRLISQLVRWGLTRKPLRTLFLLLTVVGSLVSFAFTDAVMRDLAVRTIITWRIYQYDLLVTGSRVTDLMDQVAALKGVRKVEQTIMFGVVVGVREVQVAVPDVKSELLPVILAEGRLPENEREIAISEEVAALQALQPGDEVNLALRSGLDKAVPYTVSGITKGAAGFNFVTAEGAERLQERLVQYPTLLVSLESSASSVGVQQAIERLSGAPRVRNLDEQANYGGTMSIAESLISLTRALLVGVGVVSLYMLFFLGQQERAYELGVLRALGFSRRRVITTLVLEGAFVLLSGGLIGLLMLVAAASAFDLGRIDTLLAQYLPGGGVVLGLGLIAVFWTARTFASRSITSLFKG